MWSQDLHLGTLTPEYNLNYLQYTASNIVTAYNVTESFAGVQIGKIGRGSNHHMYPQKALGQDISLLLAEQSDILCGTHHRTCPLGNSSLAINMVVNVP